MRVSKEKAAENRKKILTAAARLFRERGIAAAGVDAITGETDLTHGAFYSQFGSKEAVAAEAIRHSLQDSRRYWEKLTEGLEPGVALEKIARDYLSRAHRDEAGSGCLVAALGADVARQPKSVRDAFTSDLEAPLEILAAQMPGATDEDRRDQALSTFALLAGTLVLARAVSDDALSRRILEIGRREAVKVAARPGAKTRRARKPLH